MRRGTILLILGLAACTPKPSTPEPGSVSPLPQDDPRALFVGRWDAEFWVDSIRHPDVHPATWLPAPHPGRSVHGRLQILDSIDTRVSRAVLLRHLDLSFEAVLDRQPSCYDPGEGALAIAIDSATVRLLFTPYAADCGITGAASWTADSMLVGTWEESSFAGPVVLGGFRLTRLR